MKRPEGRASPVFRGGAQDRRQGSPHDPAAETGSEKAGRKLALGKDER